VWYLWDGLVEQARRVDNLPLCKLSIKDALSLKIKIRHIDLYFIVTQYI